MKNLFILSLISLSRLVAAPCCGSSASLPSLMVGDDRSQINTSFSLGSVSGEATQSGTVRPRAANDLDQTQRFTVGGATLLSDRLQSGFALPLVRRVRNRGDAEASAWGIADISANLAYEFLPEYSYSSLRPKGFVYFSLTAPTGISDYETGEILKVDVRGRGFWSAAVGAHLSRSRAWLDIELLTELRRSFPRTLRPAGLNEDYLLTPGWGTTVQGGVGIRPIRAPLRLGMALSHNYESSVSATGVATATYLSQAYWTAIFSAQYAFADGYVAGLSYQDQTLFGHARNVALSRTSLLTLQKAWER